MLSADRLSVLRARNKDLLKQLRQQRERLQHFSCTQSRTGGEAEAREDGEIETLTDRNLETLTDRNLETLTDRNPVEMETLMDRNPVEMWTLMDRNPVGMETLTDRNPVEMETLTDRNPREVGSGVTFHSNEREEMSASDRHHLQPLLGYDWIAGILDVESSLIERSEEFFNDLRIFRSVNKDECVHRQQAGFSEVNHSVPPLLADEDGPEADVDTHQCTFSYRINSRLFPVPLHPQECCPVCRKPKSAHPHTAAEPALIRVSIPRSTLLPAYEHKAHRRCSFDPSDSLGLPSHCLSGWWNTGQSSLPQPSSLDLQSSLATQTSTRLISAQSQSKEQLDRSVSRASGDRRSDRILNVSRLARHHFQHLSPRKQPCSSSYPVY
ncbi:migration and invasion inhibitory protein [Diretmus argenteus]